MFRVIYADPPWSFRSRGAGGSGRSGAAAHYPVMSLAAIRALPISDIAAPNAALVMWWVGAQGAEAIDVAHAWGFEVRTMTGFVWCKETATGKPHFGMGSWTRAGAECALIATRGRPSVVSHSVRSVVHAPVTVHSRKPTKVRDRIVELFGDVERIELFARERAPGWVSWGNEI